MARGLASCDVEAAVIFGFFGMEGVQPRAPASPRGLVFTFFGRCDDDLFVLASFFFGIVICKETFLVNALFFVIRLRFFSFEVRRQSHNMRLQLRRFWMICEEHLLWVMIQ